MPQKPWRCHDTLSSAGCVLHLSFSSLCHLASAGASAGASISCCATTSRSHLPWLILASTSLPPASLSGAMPLILCALSTLCSPQLIVTLPPPHIAPSPLVPTGGVLVTTKSLVVVVVARASASASAFTSHSHSPHLVVALPPVRLGLHDSMLP